MTPDPAAGRTTPKPKTARYKAFARAKGTRLIERTERVLVEEMRQKR